METMKVSVNTKDAKAIYFLVKEGKRGTGYIKARIKMETEIAKLWKKKHIIINSIIEPTIGDSVLRVGIVYIPKGKYQVL